ncbi:unnamed protein product [Phytomonas sp. Hart1]|nr:unnamed protein product [Phytomonas sp. Hart1]|eukprot:CCW71918.1 unnamed protein product [Phytomonas sp. isolate Hart1]
MGSNILLTKPHNLRGLLEPESDTTYELLLEKAYRYLPLSSLSLPLKLKVTNKRKEAFNQYKNYILLKGHMIGNANAEVASLLVNRFRPCGAGAGVPAPNVVVDALVNVVPLASCSAAESTSAESPYAMALEKIARSGPPSGKDAVPLDMTALEEQIRNVVSFPDRFASYCASLEEKIDRQIDRDVYLAKLYDTFWLFCLLNRPCEGTITSSQRVSLLYGFAKAAASRSNCKVLFERLLGIPLAQIADDKCLLNHMIVFTKGILSGSLNGKFFTKTKAVASQGQALTNKVNSCWGRWMDFLLWMATQKSEWKAMVTRLFLGIVLVEGEHSCDSAERAEASPLFIGDDLVRTFVRQFMVCDAISTLCTPRVGLKFIFETLFPAIWAAGEAARGMLAEAEDRVYRAWDRPDLVLSGTLPMNEALLHSVVYFMQFRATPSEPASSAEKPKLPPAMLSFLLNGITLRLDSVHKALQKTGMVAAAAFAKLFVDSAEAVEGLLQNEMFARALEEWREGESGALCPAPRAGAPKARPAKVLQRTEVAHGLRYPVDPDAAYLFFALPHTAKAAREEAGAGALGVANPPWGPDLAPFGLQTLPEDESDVAILRTFRAAYEALLGIGRSPNAQLHEVQQSIEAGLEGMGRALGPMKERRTRRQPLDCAAQVNPLLPSLMPTLMLLSIHAPDQKQGNLYQKRFLVVVDLIVIAPRAALSQLSTMIYGSNYAIYQRSEMIKAIGEAAKVLAQVEIEETPDAAPDKAEPRRKPIYPPIDSHPLKARTSSMEGKNTRRWGYAVEGRKAAWRDRKRYHNLLGDDAAFFLACLLARMDREHFKFFQTTDPYTPSEVLRSLVVIFQSLTRVRHVVGGLCEAHLDFFLAVARQHPHLEVRKQGWVVLGELMRSWCGAFPMVSLLDDPSSSSSSSSSFAKGNARRPAGHSSLLLTESWMAALATLQLMSEEARRKEDPCWGIAVITVASLNDIIQEKSDFNTLQSSAGNYIQV